MDTTSATASSDRRAQSRERAQRRFEAIGKLLSHPMTLLLVTAAVSGLLVPRLTQQWQEQQQQIIVRKDFAARVSRTVGEMFIATQLAQVGASSQTQEEFDAAYVRWEIESAVLGAELRAYYPGDSVHTEWTRCAELTSAYYAQSGMKDRDRRNRYLQDVQQRIDLPADVDLTVVDDLRAETLRARDRVIQGVLESEVI